MALLTYPARNIPLPKPKCLSGEYLNSIIGCDSRVVACDSEGVTRCASRTEPVTTASELRYPSDLTDNEWRLVEPLIPPGKRGGDKRTVVMREVVNGLMYVLSTGCQWRAIPKTCRRKVRFMTTSICGPTMAR